MKGRVIAVERRKAISLAALVVDGRIEALELDSAKDGAAQPGALFMAKITDTRPDMGAAFLDLGGEQAFLPKADAVQAGAILPVRITRAAETGKLARASADIQLDGRYLVFTPDKPGIHVSRRIEDQAERDRLTRALEAFAGDGGFVLRTHAQGVDAEALTQDAKAQVARFNLPDTQTPGLIAPAPDAQERCQITACALEGPAQMIDEGFETLGLDAQLIQLCSPDAPLTEGSLRIERTAACVTVDVNSGGGRGGDLLGRINRAAAMALPRELALRHLGGTVLVDFAGTPQNPQARKRFETALTRAAANRLDTFHPLGWGPAGLYEFRCARPARALAEVLEGFFDG